MQKVTFIKMSTFCRLQETIVKDDKILNMYCIIHAVVPKQPENLSLILLHKMQYICTHIMVYKYIAHMNYTKTI